MTIRLVRPLFACALLAACASACSSGNAANPGAGGGAIKMGDRVHLRGSVLDGKTNLPLGAALVAVELTGSYVDYPDTSKASPFYQFGGIAGADGQFDILVPQMKMSIHSFIDGYHYGSAVPVDDPTAGSFVIKMTPITAAETKPTATGFTVDNATVPASAMIKFSATVTRGTSTDPLSDEVLLFEPSSFWSGELDPPAPGTPHSGAGFPDGAWSRTIAAPKTAGTYTYLLQGTTENCVTSDRASVTVTVTP